MPLPSKLVASAEEAVADIADGATIAIGGFGVCGIPSLLIEALLARGSRSLHVISNNCGIDGWGLGRLLQADRIERLTASYVGENRELERRYLDGRLNVELIPQGTLAERLRAAGAGIPAFYTPAGVGTAVEDGGIPTRYGGDGVPVEVSAPREVRFWDGTKYLLERWLRADFALVRAARGDIAGNLRFAKAARNFNPLVAAAGRVTIAECEAVSDLGGIEPDDVHTPGVLVQRIVAVRPEMLAEKRIERVVSSPAGA